MVVRLEQRGYSSLAHLNRANTLDSVYRVPLRAAIDLVRPYHP